MRISVRSCNGHLVVSLGVIEIDRLARFGKSLGLALVPPVDSEDWNVSSPRR